MSKIKMRCITCGKWFQSANAKEVTCPECVQKARKEKLAAKAVPPTAQKTPGQGPSGTGNPARPVAMPPKPKPAASGTNHWFDSINDVKVSEPDPPPRPKPSSPTPREIYGGNGPVNRGPAGTGTREDRGQRGPGSYRDERNPGGYRGPVPQRDERGTEAGSGYRSPRAYHDAPLTGNIVGGISQRPRQPMEGGTAPAGAGRGPHPGPGGGRIEKYQVGGKREKFSKPKTARPTQPPKPKREKIPPPEPFKPTPEQTTQVEMRYLELATTGEFDGIRSQIADELSNPKKAVKQIVKTLREREHIPSWWESQTYKGDTEEKERILGAYQPYLPVPPVGVHRLIADQLDLKPGTVYQAIKTIRLELNLPQYNDPVFHASEFEEIKRRAREQKEAREAALAAAIAEATPPPENAATPETTEATVSPEVMVNPEIEAAPAALAATSESQAVVEQA